MRNRLLMTTIIAASGCASQLEEITDGGTGGDQVMPQYVADAFERSCGVSACHDGSTQSPPLTADTAPAIVGASTPSSTLPLVELGNLQGSYIAIKMLPDELIGDALRIGDTMPPAGQMPDPADITLILGWISSTPPSGMGGGSSDGNADGSDGMTDGMDGMDDGGPTLHSCAPEDLAPGATIMVDAADEADKIPMEIGTLIMNNCGCHLVDASELAMGISAPPPTDLGGTDLSTLAGIQANVAGVDNRINDTLAAMPPPTYCEMKDVQALSQDDFDTLKAWLADGAPDGATWMGGG